MKSDAAIQPTQFLFKHADADLCSLDDGPLAGLRHRTVIDHRGGAQGLALWNEEHLPGFLVPPHLHDCEEIISVLEGEIEARIDDWTGPLGANESILIPEGAAHGFQVVSDVPVKLLAIFNSPNPKIFRADGGISNPPWEGGASNHLES